MNPVNVFVIDDSAVVRQVADLIGEAPGLHLLGVAPDPLYALDKMQKAWPDVIVLDVEMPRMDGITFLKKIMAERPTPVVICSTLTEKGTATSLQALAAGAVDIVTKPKVGLKRHLEDNGHDLVDAIKGAAHARVGKRRDSAAAAPDVMHAQPKLNADAVLAAPSSHAMAKGDIAATRNTGIHQCVVAPKRETTAFSGRLHRPVMMQKFLSNGGA